MKDNKTKRNSKKNKLVIDKYSQPIYVPNDLYVIKNYKLEDLTKVFKWADGEEILESEVAECEGTTCFQWVRKDDKDKNYVTVILLNTLDSAFHKTESEVINLLAHEASHASFRILNYCGINLNDSTTETFSFVTGWITECCYKTWKK